MSKPVKNLITKAYQRLFDGLDSAVVIDIRGVSAIDNTAFRGALARKQIRVTVVKNTLAKRAFAGTALEPINELLDGPAAMVYGGDSVVAVARELIESVKAVPAIEFKGALMEGQVFGADQVDALSKYPTRDEAQGQVIQLVLGPAGQAISAVTSAGAAIASILQAIIDKHGDDAEEQAA